MHIWLYAIVLFACMHLNASLQCKASIYANGCTQTSITLQSHLEPIMSVSGDTQAMGTVDDINEITTIKVTSDRQNDGTGCLICLLWYIWLSLIVLSACIPVNDSIKRSIRQ